jgi:hypothetical protein
MNKRLQRSIQSLACLALVGCGDPRLAGGEVESTQAPVTSVDGGVLPTAMAGFVWANAPTGSYDPDPGYSWNTRRTTNHVTQLGTGLYRVDFPIPSTGGNVQVSAYGTQSEKCKVSSWAGTSSSLQVYVRCFGDNGIGANTTFTVSYVEREGTPGREGGYVYADQPSAPSYTPRLDYQWNSAGGAISITRSSPGVYLVNFPGQTQPGGTVEVTAYGADDHFCKVQGWVARTFSQQVAVTCFTAAGSPADSYFTAIYTTGSPNGVPSFGYAWADQPTNPSYTASSTRSRVVVQNLGDYGPVSVTRYSPGVYAVLFQGLQVTQSHPSHVKITGYGSTADTCKVTGWNSFAASVGVACFGPTGAPVDTSFTVTYSTDLSAF